MTAVKLQQNKWRVPTIRRFQHCVPKANWILHSWPQQNVIDKSDQQVPGAVLSVSSECRGIWKWARRQQALLLLHVERCSGKGSLSYFKSLRQHNQVMNNYATQSSVQNCNDTHRLKIVTSHPYNVISQQLCTCCAVGRNTHLERSRITLK